MFEINSDTVILILGIIIIALVFYIIFNNKKCPEKTLNINVPHSRIHKALKGANVTINKQENFELEDVQFNSKKIIKENFSLFIHQYYPMLDVFMMNRLLKSYNIKQDIDELVLEMPNEKFNEMLDDIFNLSIIYPILSDDTEEIISDGLSLIVYSLVNNQFPGRMFFYNGDYETTNDFTLYILPQNYTIDKTFRDTIANNDPNNTQIKDISQNYFSTKDDGTTIYKFSLDEMDKILCKQAIMRSENKKESDITDADIDDFKQFFKENKTDILEAFRLGLLSAFYIIGKNKLIEPDKDIGLDFINLIDHKLSSTIKMNLGLTTGIQQINRLNEHYKTLVARVLTEADTVAVTSTTTKN